ncbi:MAG: orotidine-5'-phosphate decarboxylase [Synergistaceae bacterium]|nr:orotidine-5'-phosphate decarboxylase [Synergistaceae bacterium]
MQIDRLVKAIKSKGLPVALGLDTKFEYVPEGFARPYIEEGGRAEAVFAFNRELMRELRDMVPCVKIQAAYYELLGVSGMDCLRQTISAARQMDYVVIVDAKRGDIGSTAEAYSGAYLKKNSPFRADFLTVNPYFGTDGMTPFLEDCAAAGNGIFALVKTSNPSSGEFQDILTDDGRPLFMRVADHVSEWGKKMIGESGYSSVGAVVGATYPEQGAALRKMMPRTFFLLPGYGAQGASAEHLAPCFDDNGGGAVIAASRSIICAYKKTGGQDFASAARTEVERMKADIERVLPKACSRR